ncbi:hypothetical protein GCM10009802_49850 [Streptomyces synnematoformans]|uniref:Secreted protein n=1 Tax=Streptomyces synnematoformans TaxID=415721 RepID=A0ABN2ZBS6_9ACTN
MPAVVRRAAPTASILVLFMTASRSFSVGVPQAPSLKEVIVRARPAEDRGRAGGPPPEALWERGQPYRQISTGLVQRPGQNEVNWSLNRFPMLAREAPGPISMQ